MDEKSIDKNIDNTLEPPHHSFMEFNWDDGKHAINLEKHKVDCADVFVAFEDAHRKVTEDCRHNYGEVRYNMLTKILGRIFHITFT